MSWHSNNEVNQAFIRLMDALCSWERDTFRNSTLVFVPDIQDEHEKIILVRDGKPMPTSQYRLLSVLDGLKHRVQSSGGTAK